MKSFVVAALLAASIPSFASDIPIHAKCANCSLAQMKSKALSATPNISIGTSRIHVYSLPTGTIRRFEVECPGAQMGGNTQNRTASLGTQTGFIGTDAVCPTARIATEVAVDTTVQAQFNALYQGYLDTGGTMAKTLTLTWNQVPGIDPTTSAYDVSDSWQLQQTLGNLIHTYALQGANNYLKYLMAAAQSAIGFLDGMHVTLKITFTDGTSSEFTWNWNESEFTYTPSSGETAGGQPIPDTVDGHNNGTWTDPSASGVGDDLRDFIQHAHRLGIPIYRADGGLVPNGVVDVGPLRKIRCTRENGRVVCRVLPR